MQQAVREFNIAVIGCGPAGTGLLYNAIRKNMLNEFLGSGVAFIDKSDNFGGGTIGRYMINSDTAGSVFLESLPLFKDGFEAYPRLQKLIRLIERRAGSPVPLEWVGEFLRESGKILRGLVESSPQSALYSNTTVTKIIKHDGGKYSVYFDNGDAITCSSVVFAMGGRQNEHEHLQREICPGLNLEAYKSRVICTDEMFTRNGLRKVSEILATAKNKKVVVIGGSHSAFSALWLLLNKLKHVSFSAADITLLHRSKLKLFYPSKEEALAEGYRDFTDEDICPLTKKVYRLAGLRLDSRDLLKKILGIGGDREARVQLKTIGEHSSNDLHELLKEAALIIPAFGYKAGIVPLINDDGTQINLFSSCGHALVNRECQIMDEHQNPIRNLYGIGLASGFVPWGKLGGEPGFVGQTNGLWLYQNGVGEMILDQLMAPSLSNTEEQVLLQPS